MSLSIMLSDDGSLLLLHPATNFHWLSLLSKKDNMHRKSWLSEPLMKDVVLGQRLADKPLMVCIQTELLNNPKMPQFAQGKGNNGNVFLLYNSIPSCML